MEQSVQDFVIMFLSIFWEALPFVIAGAVIAGILEELLPQTLLARVLPSAALPAIVLGALLGIIFPMCECGIVVVMRRLLRKGLPLSTCIAYMLAGPILNVIVLISTYAAFGKHQIGVEMVLLRAGLGILVAIVTGLVVHAQQRSFGLDKLLTATALPPRVKALSLVDDDAGPTRPKGGLFGRLSRISETALHDVVDISVFLLLGAALAAIVRISITSDAVSEFSSEMPYLSIPLMMLLAVVLCLCSEADAFVAASFTELSVSSKLAFLVLGPMLDIKLIFMWTRVFTLRLILTLIACTTLQVFVYTTILHQYYDPQPAANAARTTVTTPDSPTPTAPAGLPQ